MREIKPALYGYVREARSLLDPEVIPDDRKVHDLRVLMKKTRAVIRLIKSQVEKGFSDREYSSFREAGRIARSWRETAVHRKTLKELKKKYSGVFSNLADNEKITILMQKQEIAGKPSDQMQDDLLNIAEILDKSAYRIRFQSMNNIHPHHLIDQLTITYSEVLDCYLRARNYARITDLHEFRKKSKDFLYQLFFFRSLNPGVIKSLEKKIDEITDNLGKYNDLAVLLKSLDYKYSKNKNGNALDELAIVIKQEQDKCLMKVWPSAYRIFRPGRSLTDLLGIQIQVFM